MLTPKELPTVLAALRHWQDLEKRSPQAEIFIQGDDRTGTHFEEHDPLTVEEIDSLCERLNCAESVSVAACWDAVEKMTEALTRTIRNTKEFIDPLESERIADLVDEAQAMLKGASK